MKRVVLLCFFILAVGSGRLLAAGVPCDQSSVQTAINNAASGATVTINAGTCEWASPVLVPNKSITLQGAGCTLDANGDPTSCDTVILDAVTSGVLLQFNCETGKAHRMTGIAFKAAVDGSGNPKRTTKEQDGVLSFSCTNLKDAGHNQTTLRIDHNLVDTLYGDFFSIGSAVGVMDHNSLLVSSGTIGSTGLGTIFPIIVRGATWNDPSGLHGDRSWSSADLLYPYDPGADKSETLYIEDNKISGNGGFCGDGFSGARLVYRFNHIFGCTIEVHGTDTSGRDRGTRYLEVYKNTADYGGLSGYLKGYFANTRSGSAIFWGNTSTDLPQGVDYSELTFNDYRAYFSARSFGAAGGFNQLDQNDPNNSYDAGTPCRAPSANGTSRACTVASVISTGGSGTTISVTGNPGWTDNQWLNYSILKESCVASGGPQCVSIVSGNANGNQITFINCLGLCQQNLAFSPGETFELTKIVHTLDQPGRGGGSTLVCSPAVGTNPESCSTFVAVGQLDYPIYEWLNCGTTAATCANTYLHNGPRQEAKATVIENQQYYNFSTTFNGTATCSTKPDCGVGAGTRAQMNALPCVIGMLYWVSDEADWNSVAAGTDGQAYRCTATNVWTLFYTPYSYPHPLITGAGGVGAGGGGGGLMLSSTTLTVPVATVTPGGSVTFTATLTDGIGTVAGGTVTFADTATGATLASNVALSGAGQAATTAPLALGAHVVQATYNPDGVHSGSISNSVSVTAGIVTTATETSTALSTSAAGIAEGTPVTLTATVTANGVRVTSGTVTFTDTTTGSTLGSNLVLNNGQASIVATLGAGSHTILVTYNPDSSHSGSTSNSALITVNAAGGGAGTPTPEPPEPPVPPNVSITAPAAGATVSGVVTISANATGLTDIVSVQFKLDGTNLGGALTSTPYSLTINTYTLSNGSHSLAASAVNSASLTGSASITFTVNNPTATASYSIANIGGAVLSTGDDAGSDLKVSHVLVLPDSPTVSAQVLEGVTTTSKLTTTVSAPTGVAIFGLRANNVLVTEAGVPATPMVLSGRIVAEVHGSVTTGIAFSNLNLQSVTISFAFTDETGKDIKTGSFVLAANHQIASFLNQAPVNGPADIQGSFSFTSSLPVAAIALRGFTNERQEFLVTTLPVITSEFGSPVVPQFADGGGWTTQLVLVNPSVNTLTGTVQFFGQGSASQNGPLLNLSVNGASGTTFNYSIAPHGVARLATAGSNASTQIGSIRLAPTVTGLFSNTNVPAAIAIFSFASAGITVGQASVAATPLGKAFQMYMESTGSAGDVGSIQSGVAVANPSTNPVTLTIDLTQLDGTSAGLPSATISVPGGGQVARFINELFPNLPSTGFRGIARLTSAAPVAVTTLRTRYNERHDVLTTSTPPMDEASTAATVIAFPHIASGQGYATQIVVFGHSGSGKLYVLAQDGTMRPVTSLKK